MNYFDLSDFQYIVKFIKRLFNSKKNKFFYNNITQNVNLEINMKI